MNSEFPYQQGVNEIGGFIGGVLVCKSKALAEHLFKSAEATE